MPTATATVRAVRAEPASERLLREHYPLARIIAKRTHARLPKNVELDDLVSVAVIGLMEAVERFDPSRGVSFKSYAKHRIQGAILDSLRANDWIPRAVRRRVDAVEATRRTLHATLDRAPTAAEIAAHLEVDVARIHEATDSDTRPLLSLDAAVDADGDTTLGDLVATDETPDRVVMEREERAAALRAIDGLPERERVAVVLFYFRELSLKEVGTVLGVSESRACQLCGQATHRLRATLRPMVA